MTITETFAVRNLRQRWARLTLAVQFALAGGAVLLLGMIAIGIWVTNQIEDGVVHNTATATALYVDSVIAPLLPDIHSQHVLSAGARRGLDETLSQGSLGGRIASFKIWLEDGLVAYSNEPELIGKRFVPTVALKTAWAGTVAAEFNQLDDEESRTERAEGMPLLEIYSPIREPWSGKVVAVTEFYERADELRNTLWAARLRSWLVVAAVALCMMGLLSGIVLRGSGLIEQQRKALEGRVAELSSLLQQNTQLRFRVQRASSRAVALNESYLKRVSADLHDGPAQLLALASLRIGEASDRPTSGELQTIGSWLDEAMQEIRDICRGLTLPRIEAMNFGELLSSAIAAHERRTGTRVALRQSPATPALTHAQKICVFRFVQEGLSNAFRHAGGADQAVTGSFVNPKLTVEVADRGGGFDVGNFEGEGLGLAGLRERVESLGGEFHLESSSFGTHLAMTLPLDEDEVR